MKMEGVVTPASTYRGTSTDLGSTMNNSGRFTDMSSVLDTDRGMTRRVIDVNMNEQGVQTSFSPLNIVNDKMNRKFNH